ncbi:MAG: type II toxin-antitoxin system prevent-host-death family antitoxin [Methylococcaceae bacterium]|nr:type II toxin-antitoxin system prevent-host-death family antitoxin [Methylococcaceae bacterium]
MQLSTHIKPLSYLQNHSAELLENLNTTHQPMVITKNGEAAMVVQSVIDYEQTQETLALLKLLAQSQKAVSENKTINSTEAFSQLRQRRGL